MMKPAPMQPILNSRHRRGVGHKAQASAHYASLCRSTPLAWMMRFESASVLSIGICDSLQKLTSRIHQNTSAREPHEADDRRHSARGRGVDRHGRPGPARRPASAASPGQRCSRPPARSITCRSTARSAVAPPLHFDFVLPSGPNTFMDLLAAHLESAARCAAAEVEVRVHRVDGFSPGGAGARPCRAARAPATASAIIALDHPLVREAIRDLAAHGTPVLTLVSDIAHAPRLAYVGIDNRARRASRRPSAGPLRAGLDGRGRAVRGLAQLSRPRGAGDGLPPHPGRGLPASADRRAARGPRRSGAQLPRGAALLAARSRACAASTTSAPATGASPGRWRKPGGRAQWSSSATS